MGPTRSISEKLQGLLLRCTLHVRVGSKAPFRARIGHVRYCSHRYRIAALREYMARPAKPIKLTTRQGSGDDNASIGHDGATRSCHSSLKSSGTSPNFFNTTASENSPTFGSPARLNPTASALAGSRDIPSAGLIAAASLWHSCASPGAVPYEWESNVIGYGHGGLLRSLHIVRAYFSP